jgi:CheY-like chemotaxis protein
MSDRAATATVTDRAGMPSAANESGRTYSGLAGLHVLIVDDFEAIRMLYRAALAQCVPTLRLSMAADGLDAVRLARELRPDVILMDVMMPGLDGLEATRRIKADLHTEHVRVIAITGTIYDPQVVLECGCDGYLMKPASADEILLEILRVMRR